MKIRLAKKIMACDFRKVVRRDLPWDKELKELDILCKKSHYWYLRHYAYRPLKRIQEIRKEGWGKDLFRDHRISKAISLTNHWNARRYVNELIKLNKKHPFKLRDVQRDAERLKQCSVLKCCGNCHWFDNEDVYGVGWCRNNEHESSCDQVCDEHEF